MRNGHFFCYWITIRHRGECRGVRSLDIRFILESDNFHRLDKLVIDGIWFQNKVLGTALLLKYSHIIVILVFYKCKDGASKLRVLLPHFDLWQIW